MKEVSKSLNKTISSVLNPPNCSLQTELSTLEASLTGSVTTQEKCKNAPVL